MSRPWKVPLNNKSLPSTVESAPNVTFDKIPSSRQSPRWYKMSRRFKSNYWKYKTEQNKPVDCSTERAERDAVTLRGCFTPCQSNVCQFILWICFHQTFCSLTLINKKPPQDRRHVSTWWQRDITAAGFTHAWNSHVCFSSPAESVAWTQRWVGHFVSVSEVCWRNVDETQRHMKSNLPQNFTCWYDSQLEHVNMLIC